ncbi:hypothetical protein Hbl1158_11540 [Halobaculum sp. CBA1158]|uniref:hypothetical protein n=1 Tax=Halobaculum sp. CBA1158 TaxID=2904243 RepID=UPI001F298BC0|nr:hypothetical protein [Halobaculum sp. CBA1158]UIO99163.1 hypothetical protein Hbl1158_11540 [Halobaculum sp. CBA1158]
MATDGDTTDTGDGEGDDNHAGDAGDEPSVPIVCTECDTRTRVPLSKVGDLVDRHNDTRHDGESVAQVDPALADRIADLVAEDMGLLEGE